MGNGEGSTILCTVDCLFLFVFPGVHTAQVCFLRGVQQNVHTFRNNVNSKSSVAKGETDHHGRRKAWARYCLLGRRRGQWPREERRARFWTYGHTPTFMWRREFAPLLPPNACRPGSSSRRVPSSPSGSRSSSCSSVFLVNSERLPGMMISCEVKEMRVYSGGGDWEEDVTTFYHVRHAKLRRFPKKH